MNKLDALITLLLSTMGIAVLIVWPEAGPSAWLRDRVLRRILPKSAQVVLDCYICAGFWCGMLLAPIWWWFYRETVVLDGRLDDACDFLARS